MASVNLAIVVGNLGRDPEVRYMPNGDAVCNIAVATTESWKDKNTGEKKELTEWHRITLYRKLGEIAGQYLKKGSQVYIEGRLQTRKWTDKDGVERYTTEIIADKMQMLGGRPAGNRQDDDYNDGYEETPAARQQAARPAAQQRPQQQPPRGGGRTSAPGYPDEDDIPFRGITNKQALAI